jgi:hypothetical protein
MPTLIEMHTLTGSQNPHPNLAKGARLGWGTLLILALLKLGWTGAHNQAAVDFV